MSLKKFGILVISLFVIAGFPLLSFAQDPAGPPLTDGKDETYYEGIWQINITERCNRHTDGGLVKLGTEKLFMRVNFDGVDGYFGDLFPTLEDARNETNQVGIFDFFFDFPFDKGETFVVNGFSDRDVIQARFVGECFFEFVGWLKTAVKNSMNQLLSKLTGSNTGFCLPDDPDADPFLVCNSDWGARWLEGF